MDTAQVSPEKTNPVRLYSNRKSLPHINKYLTGLLVFLLLIIAFGGGFYFYKTKQLPWKGIEIGQKGIKISGIVARGEYITIENVSNFVSPDEKTYRGYIIPGKTFSVVEQEGSWLRISVYEQNIGRTWEGWIKVSQTAYKPKK